MAIQVIKPQRRSRNGAWIEMSNDALTPPNDAVAPVRERGLKYAARQEPGWAFCRSREGAWIEMRPRVSAEP